MPHVIVVIKLRKLPDTLSCILKTDKATTRADNNVTTINVMRLKSGLLFHRSMIFPKINFFSLLYYDLPFKSFLRLVSPVSFFLLYILFFVQFLQQSFPY